MKRVKLYLGMSLFGMLASMQALDWVGFEEGIDSLNAIAREYKANKSVSTAKQETFSRTLSEMKSFLELSSKKGVKKLGPNDKPISYFQTNYIEIYDRMLPYIVPDQKQIVTPNTSDQIDHKKIDQTEGWSQFVKQANTLRRIAADYNKKRSVSVADQTDYWNSLQGAKEYLKNLNTKGVRTIKDKPISYYQITFIDPYEKDANVIVSAKIRDGSLSEEKNHFSDQDKWQVFAQGASELNRLSKLYNQQGRLSDADQKTYLVTLQSMQKYLDDLKLKGVRNIGPKDKAVSYYQDTFVTPYQDAISYMISTRVKNEVAGISNVKVDPLDAMKIEIILEITEDLEKALGKAVADSTKAISDMIQGLGSYSAKNSAKFYKDIRIIENNFEKRTNNLKLEAINTYFEFIQKHDPDADPLHPSPDQKIFSQGAQEVVDLAVLNMRKLVLELTAGAVKATILDQIKQAIVISDQDYERELQQAQEEADRQRYEAMENSLARIAKASWEEFKDKFPQEASKRVINVLKEQGRDITKNIGQSAAKRLSDITKSIEANMSEEDKKKWQDVKEKVSEQVSNIVDKAQFGNLAKLYNDDSASTQLLRDAIKINYPIPLKHKSANISVRDNSGLCQEEQQYVGNRRRAIRSALEKEFEIKHPLKLAICCSGGGVRAMVGTLGLFKAAARHKILDVTTYIAGLSGSTWLIAPWSYMHNKRSLGSNYVTSLENFQKIITSALDDSSMAGTAGIYAPPVLSHDMQSTFLDYISMKFAYKEALSAIDVYGPSVANFALAGLKDRRLKAVWSDMAQMAQQGANPLPLCAAIYDKDDSSQRNYGWVETGPFEAGGSEVGYVPVWALGCSFDKGSISSYVPEYSMAYYLGVYGSAFALSAQDVVEHGIKNPTVNVAGIPIEIPVTSWLSDMFEGFASEKQAYDNMITKGINILGSGARLTGSYAQFPNFSKGLSSSALAAKDTIGLFDAGIDFNVPLPLLFDRKDRQVDLAIVYDSNIDARSLNLASDYFNKRNIPMPDMRYVTDSMLKSKPMTVFNDPRGPKYDKSLPTIIYIPTPSDDVSKAPYDIEIDKYSHITKQINVSKPPYITPNFKYTADDILNLSQTVEAVVDSQIKDIKAIMKAVASKKLTIVETVEKLEANKDIKLAEELEEDLNSSSVYDID